jgi:chloramphenicol 3-O-phosphotransferase
VNPATVIALAGRIDSGKSSVAAAIADDSGLPVLSFGAYVKNLASPDPSREELQELGARLLDELGAEGFVAALLAAHDLSSADSVIWEGVRHHAVLEALRRLYAPTPVRFFFLSPPEDQRIARASADAGNPKRLANWEAHSTEQVGGLRGEAELVISAASTEEAAATIAERLPNREM